VAAESAQHAQHAAAVEGPDHSFLGPLNSPCSTTMPIVRSSVANILRCWANRAARRGSRSGTASCTTCWPEWFAVARRSGPRTCCSRSSGTA
jgi:hypothetical protein